MGLSLQTVLTVIGAAETAIAAAAPAIADAQAIYNLAAPGLNAADLATAQAALSAMQAKCNVDNTRVAAEEVAIEGDPAQQQQT